MRNALFSTRTGKNLLLIMIVLAWGTPSQAAPPPKASPLPLSLAVRSAPYSGLIAVAEDKGYFTEAGLAVAIELHPSGKSALEAVCAGKTQVATVADIAFAAKALEDPSIRVFASIGTTVGDQIVARRDRNIRHPGDLRGKKIGVTAGTTSDYFLYTFLMNADIAQQEVRIVDIPASGQADALVKGEVDAVAAFEIYAVDAKKRLGDKAVSWDSQDNLAYHWLLVGRQKLADTPEPLLRLLRALVQADSFARANPEETGRIILRKWGFEWFPMKTRVSVSFGQSVVTSLQSYARWHMSKADRPSEPPNILNFLQPGYLEQVAPQAVTLFR